VNAQDAILAKLRARFERKPIPETYGFEEQITYVRSPAKRKAAFTPRRSGKSNSFALELLEDAFVFPRRKQLYIGLSKDSAENAIWRDCLESILMQVLKPEQYHYGTVKRRLELWNGSVIQLAGMDSSPQDMKRILGGKYHRAIVDECQDYTQDLESLVEGCLWPAVKDWSNKGGGFLELGGVPGTQMGEHYWYRVTKQKSDGSPAADRMPGWDVHSWTMADNPYMRLEFQQELERRSRERGPAHAQDPIFRREWLGQWVLDETDVVYKFSANANTIGASSQTALSLLSGRGWTYIMGLDLGWEDATAFVVCAYRRDDPHFYVVESKKVSHTTISLIGAEIVGYRSRYPIETIFVDSGSGTGKLVAKTLAGEFTLPVQPAEKREKETAIARMNSDFLAGKVLAIDSLNRELAAEWSALVVDRRARSKGIFLESERHQNHLADAALYAHRHSVHQFQREKPPAPPQDFREQYETALRRRASREDDPYADFDAMREARQLVGGMR
jgi:hypothetical protein